MKHVLCLLGLVMVTGLSQAATYEADVVIVGGGMGAPAAALAASRTWTTATILLTEPTDWLGGQATVQGVSAIDNAWHAPGNTIMRDNRSAHYPADYLEWLYRIATKGPTDPGDGMATTGTGWVSRECYDPRTGAWALDQMIAARPQITVLRMTVPRAVSTAPIFDSYGPASVITSLTLVQRTPINGYVPFTRFLSSEVEDWYSPTPSSDFSKEVHQVVPRDIGRGLVVIDATEPADVVVLSGASYVIGRDQTTETVANDGTPPAHNETGSQATVFPFAMTNGANDTETSLQSPWPDFATYYASQSSSFFSLGSYGFNQVWTYRRLRLGVAPPNNNVVNLGDVSMQNWNPGNDYPYSSMWLTKAATSAQLANWKGGMSTSTLQAAEKHAVAWYFYMKANKTPSWDTRLARGSDARNYMGTPHGLAKFPYIRCGRRIVGLDNFRLEQRYFTPAVASPANTSFRFFDSVGIGNYAADVHPINGSTGVGIFVSTPAPFHIPYRSLASANIRNLLVGGKNFAGTYGTNSAYRLHPIEWAMGSASGTAAGLMGREQQSNRTLLEIPRLRQLQNAVAANSPIHWRTIQGANPIPPNNGDLIVNNFSTTFAEGGWFPVEVWHPKANRMRVHINSTYRTEVNGRINGRLLAPAIQTPGGSFTVRVDLYDGPTLVDQITGGPYSSSVMRIVDDVDTGFSRSGPSWITTANSNKYGPNCFLHLGAGTGSTTATAWAKWKLNLPVEGIYLVETFFSESSNRATNAPFTVNHMGGATTVLLNQTQSGAWMKVGTTGTYQFRGNDPENDWVLVTNHQVASGQYIAADAIRATLLTQTPVELSEFLVE
jgi:hypothetical protein